MKKLYIIGAGGHGQVVSDCAKAGGFEIGGFLDDNKDLWGKVVNGIEVLGGIGLVKKLDGIFVVAIGDNFARKKVVERLNLGIKSFATIIHPSAIIGSDVDIGYGTMIVGEVVVNTHTKVGNHVIVNTMASLDHHNVVEDYVHVAPGVHTGGSVFIGEGTLLGIGSSIIPGIKIGKWAVIGAGSVVIRDVPDYATVVGNPGKVIKIKGVDL
ncbi:MAG: acetyltransferase [Caldisericum sp.]|uniref:acetyltransferase n=1 Tax=unclassified Caldisericum TaxID=2641600 RepID=UPI0039FCF8F3